MNRTARNQILLILALIHLLADVAFAGGAVLCVGPDDHRAIESEHVVEVGCDKSQKSTSLDTNFSERAPSSEDCTDSPLHSEAELVSSSDSTPDTAPAAIGHLPYENALVDADTLIRPRPRAPAETAALRAHRTTVLII